MPILTITVRKWMYGPPMKPFLYTPASVLDMTCNRVNVRIGSSLQYYSRTLYVVRVHCHTKWLLNVVFICSDLHLWSEIDVYFCLTVASPPHTPKSSFDDQTSSNANEQQSKLIWSGTISPPKQLSLYICISLTLISKLRRTDWAIFISVGTL